MLSVLRRQKKKKRSTYHYSIPKLQHQKEEDTVNLVKPNMQDALVGNGLLSAYIHDNLHTLLSRLSFAVWAMYLCV